MTSSAGKSPKAALRPIESGDVEPVARFLHEHLNRRFSAEQWVSHLRTRWLDDVPNHGFLLESAEGAVVGALCALYSRQHIRGEWQNLCNPHSWCVLPEYRSQSLGLVMAVIRQRGYHFTMFTPNEDGIEIFSYLKFQRIGHSSIRAINYPTAWLSGQVKFLTEPDAMVAALEVRDAQTLADHLRFPWLESVVFQFAGKAAYFLYKREVYKKLAAAHLLYQSDASHFLKCWAAIRSHLASRGMATTRMEHRLIPGMERYAAFSESDHQRLFLSASLEEQDIQYLYSEMVALDL